MQCPSPSSSTTDQTAILSDHDCTAWMAFRGILYCRSLKKPTLQLCNAVPNRPLRPRRDRFGTLLQHLWSARYVRERLQATIETRKILDEEVSMGISLWTHREIEHFLLCGLT